MARPIKEQRMMGIIMMFPERISSHMFFLNLQW